MWFDYGCSNWPVTSTEKQPDFSAKGAPPIVVVGTTRDPATPYAQAVEARRRSTRVCCSAATATATRPTAPATPASTTPSTGSSSPARRRPTGSSASCWSWSSPPQSIGAHNGLMSNAEADRELVLPQDEADLTPTFERLEPRSVLLGPRTEVRRVLPNKGRRMIGAWCFVDHYGPEDISNAAGMRVAPHPHTGLQTVSWLLDGEIHHRDTLGSDVLVVPGQLNLMTPVPGSRTPRSRHRTLADHARRAAVGRAARSCTPRGARDFTQYADLPRLERPGLTATVIIGAARGRRVPGDGVLAPGRRRARGERGRAVELRVPATSTACWRSTTALVVEGERLAVSEIGYVGAGATRPRPAHGRRTGSWVAARRRAVRRGAGDVVELHRSLARGDRRVPRAVERRGRPVRPRRGV